MTDVPVLYKKTDGIGEIWLNRPEACNRINRKMFYALDASLTQALSDPEVRVIVLAAKGEHFCCGFDVGDPESSLNNNDDGSVKWEDRRANTQEEIDMFMKILNADKPIIGALKGRALGGGYFLAMLCDCIVAADNTIIDNGEFALGMSYTNYLPLEAWKLPMNLAKEKAFTGYPITAKEGFRIGLFNRVTAVEKVEECAHTLARRMLRLSPYTLTMHKELYNMAYRLKGIQNIVPFAKEVFNIAMELPGTKENREIWQYARENPGGSVVDLFEKKLAELRKEELEELDYLDDLY